MRNGIVLANNTLPSFLPDNLSTNFTLLIFILIAYVFILSYLLLLLVFSQITFRLFKTFFF